MRRGIGLLLGLAISAGVSAQDSLETFDYGARAAYTLSFGERGTPLAHSLSLASGNLRSPTLRPAVELRWGAAPELRLGGLGAIEAPEDDDEPVFLGLTQREWTYALIASGTLIAALLIVDHINDTDTVSGTGSSN